MRTRSRSRKRRAAVLAVLALGTSAFVAGCSGGSPGPGVITPVEPTVTTRVIPPTPQGGVWEWALGRNAWEDAALAELAASLGRSSKTNLIDHENGFELDLDGAGGVIAVVLYNDEAALGYSPSETSFRAYGGNLPGGLSWHDTYDTVVAAYGPGQNQTGGWGAEYTFSYPTSDGRRVDVTYVAKHSSELSASRIHTITVRGATG